MAAAFCSNCQAAAGERSSTSEDLLGLASLRQIVWHQFEEARCGFLVKMKNPELAWLGCAQPWVAGSVLRDDEGQLPAQLPASSLCSAHHLLEAGTLFNRCQRHVCQAGSAKFVLPRCARSMGKQQNQSPELSIHWHWSA